MTRVVSIASPARRRAVLVMEVCALAGLVGVFVVRGLLPAWKHMLSDFPNYYIVARLLHEGYTMDRVYDWVWFQRVKDHWSIPQELVGFAGLTPFSALPVLPLSWLDAMEAKRVWLTLNLVILGAMLFGLHRITGIKMHHVALIAFLDMVPLRNHFLAGQMHVLVVALLVLAFWLDRRGRWLACGIVLGIAASLKVYPLFFVFFLARKRQWKTAVVLAASTLVILAACFLIFGSPLMRVFLVEQFPRMLRGEATDPFSLTAPSLSTMLHRLFLRQAMVNPHPLVPSPLLYSLLYPLWQLGLVAAAWFSISPSDQNTRCAGLEWSAWILLLLTLSTEPASYHRVALIPVALLALPALGSLREKATLVALYFVACNVHPSAPKDHPGLALVIDFIPYWALLGTSIFLFLRLRRRRDASHLAADRTRTLPAPRVAWALTAFIAVWAALSVATYAHSRALDASEFVTNKSTSGFASYAPHIAGVHTLTVSMHFQGYRVEDESGRIYPTSLNGVEDDQLAIASNSNSNHVWIEALNNGRSRLVEISLGAAGSPTETIGDAESPAISPDGSALAFLRESKGIGQAWVAALGRDGRLISLPQAASPRGMNVQDTAFASDGGLLLAAGEHGASHLYLSERGAGPRRLFAEDAAMRWPAVQSDGGAFLWQQRVGSYWRLFASEPGARGSVQLTFGDCNAYDPVWRGRSTLLYISDCGRGNGLGALSELDRVGLPADPGKAVMSANSSGAPGGETEP